MIVNKRLLTTALVGMMVFCAFFPSTCAPAKSTKQKLNETNERIKELKDRQKELSSQMDGYEDDLEGVSAQIANLDEQITDTEEGISLVEDDIKTLKKDIKDQKTLMSDRIKYTYENGSSSSYLASLLESDSISDLLNRTQYIMSVRKYDQKIMDEYVSSCRELSSRKKELQSQKDDLSSLLSESEEKKQTLSSLLENAQNDLEEAGDELSVKMKRAQKLQDKIEEETLAAAQAKARALAEARARKAQEDSAVANAGSSSSWEDQQAREDTQQGTGPVSSTTDAYDATDSDIELLSALIECEAGGEIYEGQLAVGSVVMNRIDSSEFPNTLEGVIYQSGQFSPVASGKLALVLSNKSWSSSCEKAAKEVLGGTRTVEYLYFHSAKGWTSDYGYQIGNQIFY